MPRPIALLILVAVWAILYLTNLGSSELRSEEGHRVLPAVQMLETGNYLVPYIANRPYLNKPPLINWMWPALFNSFRRATNGPAACRPLFFCSRLRSCSRSAAAPYSAPPAHSAPLSRG